MTYVSFSGERYSSIEKYIQEYIKGNAAWIAFKDLDDFNELYQKGLLKEGMQIRTSDKGIIDEMYHITKSGKLEGISFSGFPYKGEKGIHNPGKILYGKRISAGWSIFGRGNFKYNFAHKG